MNEIRAHRVYILPENGGTPSQREVVFLEELKRACQLDSNNQLIQSTRSEDGQLIIKSWNEVTQSMGNGEED